MKNYIILGVVGVLIYFLIIRKKKKKEEEMPKEESVNEIVLRPQNTGIIGSQSVTEQIVGALKEIADTYGIDIARRVEKMARLETDHFRSGGFKRTNGMGMEIPQRKLDSGYPFGWPSMKAYWDKIEFVPEILSFRENSKTLGKGKGPIKHFVKFPNVKIGLMSLAHFVKNRKWEEWRALDPVLQAEYRTAVNGVKAKITDKISNNA